jgi:cytidylate kinase
VIITIDGPAGSGKSTLAKNIASKFGFFYLDTGATYRALALAAKRLGLDEGSPDRVAELAENCRIELLGAPDNQRVLLDGEDVSEQIRPPDISDLSSRVSTVPRVRRALVNLQRRMAEGHDVVLEGRDTGSVVFPDADLKIYLDASIEERAKRRADDWDEGAELVKIESEIARRDERDRTRPDSPLVVPDGAVIIDSTALSAENVLGRIIGIMQSMGLRPGA